MPLKIAETTDDTIAFYALIESLAASTSYRPQKGFICKTCKSQADLNTVCKRAIISNTSDMQVQQFLARFEAMLMLYIHDR